MDGTEFFVIITRFCVILKCWDEANHLTTLSQIQRSTFTTVIMYPKYNDVHNCIERNMPYQKLYLKSGCASNNDTMLVLYRQNVRVLITAFSYNFYVYGSHVTCYAC